MNYNYVLRFLKDIKTLFQKEGWIKHESFNSQGYCLVGAMEYIDCLWQLSGIKCNLVELVPLFKKVNPSILNYPSLEEFNDAPETTKEDIFEVLDRTIDYIEENKLCSGSS